MLSRRFVRPTAVTRPVRLLYTPSRRERPERPSGSGAKEEAGSVSASTASGAAAASHGPAGERVHPGCSADVVSSPSPTARPAETASLLARLGVGGSSGAAANAPQRLFTALQLQMCSDAEIRQVFGRLDADGDGAVTESDLRAVLRRSQLPHRHTPDGAAGATGAEPQARAAKHGVAAGADPAGVGAGASETSEAGRESETGHTGRKAVGQEWESGDGRREAEGRERERFETQREAEEDAAVQLLMVSADSKVACRTARGDKKKYGPRDRGRGGVHTHTCPFQPECGVLHTGQSRPAAPSKARASRKIDVDEIESRPRSDPTSHPRRRLPYPPPTLNPPPTPAPLPTQTASGQPSLSAAAWSSALTALAERRDPRIWPLAASMLVAGTAIGIVLPLMPMIVNQIGLSSAQYGQVAVGWEVGGGVVVWGGRGVHQVALIPAQYGEGGRARVGVVGERRSQGWVGGRRGQRE